MLNKRKFLKNIYFRQMFSGVKTVTIEIEIEVIVGSAVYAGFEFELRAI